MKPKIYWAMHLTAVITSERPAFGNCVFRSKRSPNLDEGGHLIQGKAADSSGGIPADSGLAQQVAAVIGFTGRIVLYPSYPDGTPQKLLDVSRMPALGWHRTPLKEGLQKTYDWFCRSRGLGPREATPSGWKL